MFHKYMSKLSLYIVSCITNVHLVYSKSCAEKYLILEMSEQHLERGDGSLQGVLVNDPCDTGDISLKFRPL